MIKKIEFDEKISSGHIIHVTEIYLFGKILLFAHRSLMDTFVEG
jgi:hypothetical protein